MQQLSFDFFPNRHAKILVIGSGGREHALVWKLKQSRNVGKLFCAPGNGGIATLAECVAIEPSDIERLADFAAEQEVNLTVVGPELPLSLGIVNTFNERGLKIFGPTQEAARLESSKVFAKQFMQRHGIPTAAFDVFETYEAARAAVNEKNVDFPLVIKADGLAAGKGVIIAKNEPEAQAALKAIMQDKIFAAAGDRVLVEEFLPGEEASFMVLTDGTSVEPMVAARDHKQVFDGDKGPNTGGMGAYSTDDILSKSTRKFIMERIVEPTIEGMAEEGTPYRGVLYVGLMLTPAGPKVLEYNARLGDPETQVVLPRMQSDLVAVLEAVAEERLYEISIEWAPRMTVTVVLASGGYPGAFEKGKLITGLEMAEEIKDVVVFHSGTQRTDDKFYTSGGRVLSVTGSGNDLSDAIIKAYEAVNKIHFDGMHYRRDIGAKGLRRSL